MHIIIDPDESIVTSSHQANPAYPLAECGCTSSWGLRRATPEECQENRKQRLETERKDLQNRLNHVNLELS